MTHKTELGSGFRVALFAGLATAVLITATAAQAQTTHAIHIPAGPLDAALITLATQTHEQLLYTPRLVAGRTTPAVDGDLTAEQALARMIRPSDIVVARTGPSIVVLRAASQPVSSASSQNANAAQETVGGRPFVPGSDGPLAAMTAPRALEQLAASTPATVSEVEVTGSHIPGTHTASPLLVLSQGDLYRTGQSTVAEALKALPQNFGGGAADGTATTGADRTARNPQLGTGLNLRGLGNNATLVLVNGRRLAGSGSFGDFTDVSSIPTVAVERVEILLDGASAIYGSDAVGGVVNIILRKSYDGAETRLLAGGATEGHPDEVQASQVIGKRWSTGGLLFSYEYQQRTDLPGADRPFAATSDLRSLGGTDLRVTTAFPGNILVTNPVTHLLAPGFAIPSGQNGVGLRPSDLLSGVVNLQNSRIGEDLLPRQTLNAVYAAGDQMLGDRLQISADVRYSSRRFLALLPPPVSNLTVTIANPFFVSPIGATRETIAYSFAGDLPSPHQAGTVDTLGVTLGGALNLAHDWNAEGYLTFGQETDVIRNSGALNSLALNEALGTTVDNPATAFSTAQNGFFNPFSGVAGSNNAAVLAYIATGRTFTHSRDQVSTANLQVDGALWQLPAGPIKVAVGVQVRHEALDRRGFNLFSTVAPVPTTPENVDRNVEAGFAELQVPLFGPDNRRPGFERLDLSIAGRVENYEGIGSTANPALGAIWAPLPDWKLRATYGRSFRAPSLRETSDPSTFAPTLLALNGSRVQSLILLGGNPTLRPETARSWTLGADFAPARWPGLTLSLTYFNVAFHNRIGQPVSANLANALSDPTLTSFITLISPASRATDLALIKSLLASPALSTVSGVFPPESYGAIADDRFVNTTTLDVEGLDLTGRDQVDVGSDRLIFGANASYMIRYAQQTTPSSSVVDEVNVANFPLRFRGRMTADWTHGRLTSGLALNYTGAYHDTLGAHIASQSTVDFQMRLAPTDTGAFRGLSIALNVRNLFDTSPPFYNNPVGIGYDAANADPIGRYVSLQLTRAW
jgi:outer membrane receptor protein involved in Fe transport